MAELNVEQLNEKLTTATEKIQSMEKAFADLSGRSADFGSRLVQAGKQIETGVSGFATAMANGQQGASAFNGVINSGKDALGTMLQALGPLGTAFSKLTDFAGAYLVRANQQGDALFKSFQDLSRVGGAGAEGMTGVFNNMQQFGLSMNQLPEFGAMITQNSEALAVMGGTVSQGTKVFANVASSIQQSGLQAEFERMGLTTKNINEGTANYLRIQTLTGMSAQKSQEALNAGAAEYITQQDKLSRLTGKSAEALGKEAEARQSNERYAAVTLELQMKAAALRAAGDEAGAKAAEQQFEQNEERLKRAPASMKQGMMDLMTGFANSPEAQKIMISIPQTAQDLMAQQTKTGEQFEQSMVAQSAEMKGAAERNIGLAKAGVYNKVGADFAGLVAGGKMPAGAAATQATKEQTDIRKGSDVDINNQVAMREAQRATTQAMDILVQKGVGPVTEKLKDLSVGIERVITALPGIKETNIPTKARPGESNSGRGENAPAIAGYKTDWSPEELANFFKQSASIVYDELRKVGQPTLTNTETHDILSGKKVTPKNNITNTETHDILSGKKVTPKNNITNTETRDILSEKKPPVAPQSGYMPFSLPDQFAKLEQSVAGPKTDYRTTLDNSRPENERTATQNTVSNNNINPDLTQGIMILANNIGLQTSSMNELVDLMRRSVNTQGKILQQGRN